MNWRIKLLQLEQDQDWNSAIAFMQEIINKNAHELDVYLSINYLLVNLVVEEQYDLNSHHDYVALLKKYFIESYTKFSNNAEYLFYMGQIASIAEWYFDLKIEEAQGMMKMALRLEPHNKLYKWAQYSDLDMRLPSNRIRMAQYAQEVLNEVDIKDKLQSKGSLGKYLLNILVFWTHS